MVKNTFGKNLKHIRTSRNLTQEELAEKLGIVNSTISQYENGLREPKFNTVNKIANLLNVTYDDLMSNH